MARIMSARDAILAGQREGARKYGPSPKKKKKARPRQLTDAEIRRLRSMAASGALY